MPPFSQVQICMRSVHVQILDSLDSVVVDALGLALTAQADALPSRQFSPYFLRFVQFLRQPPHDLLMRSFISRHLILRKCLIAHALCLARPDFKIGLGHFAFTHASKVFFIRPLVDLLDIVVVDFFFEAFCRSYFTAGLPALPRCRFIAIQIRRARSLQKPAAAVRTALRNKALLQSLH